MQVVGPGKQRGSVEHFSEETAEGPDVEGGVVGPAAEEHFGRLVPGREAFDRELARLVLVFQADRESEVGYFDDALAVDQDVARLDVLGQPRLLCGLCCARGALSAR